MIQTIDFEQLLGFLKICRYAGPLTGADVKAAISKQTGETFCRVYFNKETNEIERLYAPECGVLDEDVVAHQREILPNRRNLAGSVARRLY